MILKQKDIKNCLTKNVNKMQEKIHIGSLLGGAGGAALGFGGLGALQKSNRSTNLAETELSKNVKKFMMQCAKY